MRTTLTIDDDVAAVIERLRRTDNVNLKNLVNEALRLGLREMTTEGKPHKPFRTRPVDLGRLLIGSIDNIGEALAIGDREDFH